MRSGEKTKHVLISHADVLNEDKQVQMQLERVVLYLSFL